MVLTGRHRPGLWSAALLALACTGCAEQRPAPPEAIGPAVAAEIDSPPGGVIHPGQRRAGTGRADGGRTDAAVTMEQQLDRLFADDTRTEQALDPLGALGRGEAVPQELLAMLFTPELTARQRALNARSLAALAAIDRTLLDGQHRLSYDVFQATLTIQRDLLSPASQALLGVQPFNHFNGFPVEFPEMAATDEGDTLIGVGDFEARIATERALPILFANAIARFREGMTNGIVEPRLTVVDMIAQIDTILARPPEQSLFMSPAHALPRSFGAATRARLTREFREATRDAVYPAYRSLRRFLTDEYLPAARATVGLSALRDGDRLYRLLIRQHTTLDLDPDVVHRAGLGEVARIQQEMRAVEHQLGHDEPLRAFFDVIRRDPAFHPRSPADLAKGYRAVGARVAQLAPRWFAHLPRTPLVIMPYPAYRARFEAGGGYSQGMPDGSRPGVFFYNTYDLKSRFLSGVTTLYLHEGAPGHHFQISLAQENAALPDFQRFGGNAAFVEGWALYAETLGYDMGLYADPKQHWGTLDDEMLRAMRLVVDTGLHTRGWTRDQAIDYMLANSGIGRSDAAAEVDRYIANPGQALSYKVGAMTIQRLRALAEHDLGPRFDIRAFHDQVLNSGALPLGVLDAKIRQWIADRKADAKSAPAL